MPPDPSFARKIVIRVIFGAGLTVCPRRGLVLSCCPIRIRGFEAFMVWYIAVTAILNLGLGYVLAVYFGVRRPQLASAIGDDMDGADFAGTDVEA